LLPTCDHTDDSEISEMSYICNEIVEEPLSYKMPLDDYKECIVHDNNKIPDHDETSNAMEYDEDVFLNDNVENNTNNKYSMKCMMNTNKMDCQELICLRNFNVQLCYYHY